MVTREIALNNASAAAVSERKISITSTTAAVPQIDFINTLAPVVKTVYAAEVAGAATVTLSAPANNTTYSFVIKQEVDGQENVMNVSYTSDASGTESEIETAIDNVLDKLAASGQLKATWVVGGSGVYTIAFTASAGYPILKVIAGQNCTVGSVTNGKYAVNAGADLVAKGVENADAANTYTSYEFYTQNLSRSAGMEGLKPEKLVLYLKTGTTAIASLDTILAAGTYSSNNFELKD